MSTRKKRLAAKGDRLNWTPLKDVMPVKVSAVQIKGRIVKISKTALQPTLIVP